MTVFIGIAVNIFLAIGSQILNYLINAKLDPNPLLVKLYLTSTTLIVCSRFIAFIFLTNAMLRIKKYLSRDSFK